MTQSTTHQVIEHDAMDTTTTQLTSKTVSKGIQSIRRKRAISTALMMASTVPLSSMAMAQTSNNQANHQPETTLPTIEVSSRADSFKKDVLDNVKYTQPLVDVPQTIDVITEELIEEQKASSLMDALRNTPGITMQLGENGSTSEGDAISMRGFSGNDLFLVDGIRNIAPISRDTFNVESIEVTKGGSGSELGRAATGGAINLVTKQPKPWNDRVVSASVDRVGQARVTADINQTFGETAAGRLNAIYEAGDVVGRDVVKKDIAGVAPSVTWGFGTPTRITAAAEIMRQRNVPEGGISTIGMDGYFGGRTDYTASDLDFSDLKGLTPEQALSQLNQANAQLNKADLINSENYYGNENDFEDVDSNIYTLKVVHDFNDDLSLTNTTRYALTKMQREMSAPYNVYNSPFNIGWRDKKLTINEDLASFNMDSNNPDTWKIRTIRQGVDRENQTIANQTNINILDVKTGSLSHDVSTGIELIQESQKNMGLDRPKNNDYISAYHPDPSQPQGRMTPNGGQSEGKTNTIAGYVFDTVAIGDKIKLTAGIRADNYHTHYEDISKPDDKGNQKKSTLKTNGTLLSYKGAVLFKPTTTTSVYGNYSLTQTPPGSNNFRLGDSGRYGNNPSYNPKFEPQETTNWEVGGKWDLLDDQLSLSLAYYNTLHKNELSKQNDGSDTYVQFGERTVDGVEFLAQGQINPRWRVNAGIQTMNTEITKGEEKGRSANGAAARWSPELTGTVWSSYDVTDRITLGGGLRYVGEQKRQVDPSADYDTTNMPVIPEYWVADGYASYRVNDALSVDLNIYNMFDKDYISTLNNGGARVIKGEPLNAMATLTYKF